MMTFRRRRKAVDDQDTGSDSDNNAPQCHVRDDMMDPVEKERAAAAMLMHDLGGARRHHITTDDISTNNHTDLKLVRDCEKQGTEAAIKAAKNKQALSGWADYGSTVENDGTYENLPDIAGGQMHRLNKANQQQQGILSKDQERNYGDATRGRGSRARGGGFAGRNPGRIVPSDRPLDPAVDPNRAYTYKGRGPNNYSPPKPSKLHASMNNNGTVKLTKTTTSQPNGKPGTTNKSVGMTSKTPAMPSRSLKLAIEGLLLESKQGKMPLKSPLPKLRPPPATVPYFNGSLASPESFMAALVTPSFNANSSTMISAQANHTQPTHNSPQIRTVSVVDLKSNRPLSPTALTSGRPSPGELSLTVSTTTEPSRNGRREEERSHVSASESLSAAVKSEEPTTDTLQSLNLPQVRNNIGLGILEVGTEPPSAATNTSKESSRPTPMLLDLLDSADPEVETPSLVASPRDQPLPAGMELIQASEADTWRTIKAYIASADNYRLLVYVKSLQNAARETKLSSQDHITTHDGYKIGKAVTKNTISLLGDHNLPNRKPVNLVDPEVRSSTSMHATPLPEQQLDQVEEIDSLSTANNGLNSPWEKSLKDALPEIPSSGLLADEHPWPPMIDRCLTARSVSPNVQPSMSLGRENPFIRKTNETIGKMDYPKDTVLNTTTPVTAMPYLQHGAGQNGTTNFSPFDNASRPKQQEFQPRSKASNLLDKPAEPSHEMSRFPPSIGLMQEPVPKGPAPAVARTGLSNYPDLSGKKTTSTPGLDWLMADLSKKDGKKAAIKKVIAESEALIDKSKSQPSNQTKIKRIPAGAGFAGLVADIKAANCASNALAGPAAYLAPAHNQENIRFSETHNKYRSATHRPHNQLKFSKHAPTHFDSDESSEL